MKTWKDPEVEIIPMRVSAEEYNQLLAEFAELVYRHLCQLHENLPEVPETLHAQERRKTGTDA